MIVIGASLVEAYLANHAGADLLLPPSKKAAACRQTKRAAA